jgi:hypothetical protein
MPIQPKTPTTRVTPSSRSTSAGGSSPSSDFITLTTPKRQAIALIFGDSKTGKTSFATRFMPDPIALINFDRRARAAVLKAQEEFGKKVPFLSCDLPARVRRMAPNEARLAALDIVDKVVRNIEWAAEESLRGNVRTICLDTGTEFSEILKLSFDGVIGQTKEGAYGRDKDYVNRQWWNIFNIVRDSNAHLLITARAAEIWIKNPNTGQQEATGRFKYKGPSVVADGVDWAGNIRLRKGLKGRLKKEFELEITSAGENLEELGKVYTEKDWEDLGGPFVYSCLMQYLGSSMEDWM